MAATRLERDRLRRDLHDGLGPSLAGVSLGLEALDDARARRDDVAAGDLSARIREEVTTAVAEVRRILDDLRPAVLDSTRLPEAIRRHAAALSAGGSLEVHVSADGLPLLPADVETTAYRIVREALTNVVRHAEAGRVDVSLTESDGALLLRVADDGRGLHGAVDGAVDGAVGTGVGLGSMRQRATALGGRVDVASDHGGTTVLVTLPLPRSPA